MRATTNIMRENNENLLAGARWVILKFARLVFVASKLIHTSLLLLLPSRLILVETLLIAPLIFPAFSDPCFLSEVKAACEEAACEVTDDADCTDLELTDLEDEETDFEVLLTVTDRD